MARSLPAWISEITEGGVTNMTSMLPLNSAATTSDAPLNGTCSIVSPAALLKRAAARMKPVANTWRAIEHAVLPGIGKEFLGVVRRRRRIDQH